MPQTSEDQFLSLLLRLQYSGPDCPPFEETRITPAQFAYLDCVAAHPQATLQEITTAMAVSAASASNAARLLEQNHLLQREPNPQDGRSFCFTLTPAGQAVHDRITAYRRQKAHALLANLNPAEQEQFFGLFARLLSDTESIKGTPR